MAGIEAIFLGYSIVIVPTTLYDRLITVDLMLVEISREDETESNWLTVLLIVGFAINP